MASRGRAGKLRLANVAGLVPGRGLIKVRDSQQSRIQGVGCKVQSLEFCMVSP